MFDRQQIGSMVSSKWFLKKTRNPRKPGWNGAKGFKGVNKGQSHRWKIGIHFGLLCTLGFWSVGSTFNGQSTHIQNAALWLYLNFLSSSPRFLGVHSHSFGGETALDMICLWIGRHFSGTIIWGLHPKCWHVDTKGCAAREAIRVAYNLQPETEREKGENSNIAIILSRKSIRCHHFFTVNLFYTLYFTKHLVKTIS